MANESPQAESASTRAGAALQERVVLDDLGIRRSLVRIAHEIVERNEDLGSLYIVGVPNGGVPLARQLADNLREITGIPVIVGILDTTLYRDDLLGSGERPPLRRTEMPSAVDDRIVILVDDVFSTGRTVRAAMDALIDFGRPRAIRLAVLVDRGHRELPIRPDYVGKNLPTAPGERVNVRLEETDGRDEVAIVPAGEFAMEEEA